MDRKTLGYMEEKVKNQMLERIEQLQRNIEKAKKVESVRFTGDRNDWLFDSSLGNFTDKLVATYIEVATAEIERLEQELAEL